MKRNARYLALLGVLVLVIAACGDGADDGTTTTAEAEGTTTTAEAEAEETATTAEAEATTTTEAPPSVEAITACQVTDTGGIDDKSFNQTAWKGVTDAIDAGLATADSDFLESQSATDYQPNIQAFLDKGCDLIITVGFLLGADTETMANANPDQHFQIIDFAYEPGVADSVQGAVFGTTDAAFLAGYLAAGVTETGIVATYGGIQIPCAVTCFMDGFVYGVRYYNEVNGTDVQTLGWNPEDETGVFTGDFEDLAKGRAVTQSFVDEGADVILPVAGPVGEGSAALALELGDVWVIGVDADWFETLPQYEAQILSSVLKGLDVAVFTAIREVAEGTFEGGTRLYAIAEDGVGLGAINDDVPQPLQDEVAALLESLKEGSIVPGDQALS
ncbi:MAG: BMP family ABC transporter substrate-binding protein [Acidobacteria bacterium]|nr:MAG: BMP family ABC transporter substrate-binding protein [Acidobacteriota bacterium]